MQMKVLLDLKAKELVLMSNLYLSKDYPFNFLTLGEVAGLLGVSKATAISVTLVLERRGLLTKERGYISFYYPVRDDGIRRQVLSKLGLF